MRRQFMTLFGLWLIFLSGLSITRALELYHRPSPAWMTSNQWYDEALVAIMCAIVAAACIVYEVRKILGRENKTTLWRDKTALRFVLYVWASWAILRLPIGVFKAMEAMQDPLWLRLYFFPYPIESLIWAALGIVVIVYDRRRLRRERSLDNLCTVCGYDLRATPDRCPECGTEISR